MKPYKVKYRFRDSFIWHTLKNIVQDGYIPHENGITNLPIRWFMDVDDERYEIPANETVFKFSSSRQRAIEEAEKERKKEMGLP